MALKYTEEKLCSLDKETIIQLFLSQQEQLENIDRTLQLVLEQMADLKRHRFGRSSGRKVLSSFRTKYTADTVLPRPKSKWKNTT